MKEGIFVENTLIVRPMEAKDGVGLLEIENNIWTYDNSPIIHQYQSVEDYQDTLDGYTIFVATDEQQVYGYVSAHHPTGLPAHRKQWMLGIGVHPNSQSLGIGRRLLDAVKQAAAENDIHKLSLRVMSSNSKAIHFYRKNGFIQEALFKDEFFLNGRYCDDYQFAYFIKSNK